jgi:hypothetical protein
VGRQLTATVADVDGRVEAYVAPGASIPLVFATTNVRFTAGPTAYELSVRVDQAPFTSPVVHHHLDGDATVGAAQLTPDQKRLVVALCEPVLLGDGRASVAVPSLATVAARLGWSSTKLNRKLDNVCQKLSKLGVRGLHGGPDRLASNRRSRLVEYALAVRLVTRDDLALLDVAIDSESDHIP